LPGVLWRDWLRRYSYKATNKRLRNS